MKSALRKSIAMIIAAAFLALSITGCGDSSGESNAAGASGTSSAAGEASGLPMTNGKYEPPVTLTAIRSFDDSVKFKSGETLDDNVFNDWLLETLGIKLEYLWTSPTTNNAFQTKLMLTMTANEPLPDFLSIPGGDSHDMIESKRFQPVSGLFEQYASENWKKAMGEVPSAWLPYMRDGQAYAIPQIEYAYQHEDSMWMRRDWLEKLNLEAPTNMEELETVMEAFTKQDPDGNGVDDTYGMAAAMKANYNAWVGSGEIFGAYGAVPQIWQFDKAGDIVYGSVMPEIKEGLRTFKRWIDNGYVNKEIGLFDEMQASAAFTSGKTGIVFGPTWLIDWPLNETAANDPNADVWPYPLPVGPDGTVKQASEGTHYTVLMLNKDFEHPEILFTFINYLYDELENPAAGGPYEYGFIKGYDYDIVDGVPVYADDQIEGGYIDVQKYYPTAPARTPSLMVQTLADIANGKEPTTPYEKTMLASYVPGRGEAAKIVISQKDSILDNIFTGAPTKNMVDKLANLNKLETEEFSKILYGKIDLDEGFDKFVEDWYANGGQQITDDVRQWYADAQAK